MHSLLCTGAAAQEFDALAVVAERRGEVLASPGDHWRLGVMEASQTGPFRPEGFMGSSNVVPFFLDEVPNSLPFNRTQGSVHWTAERDNQIYAQAQGATWDFPLDEPGSFRVKAQYRPAEPNAGCPAAVFHGGQGRAWLFVDWQANRTQAVEAGWPRMDNVTAFAVPEHVHIRVAWSYDRLGAGRDEGGPLLFDVDGRQLNEFPCSIVHAAQENWFLDVPPGTWTLGWQGCGSRLIDFFPGLPLQFGEDVHLGIRLAYATNSTFLA